MPENEDTDDVAVIMEHLTKFIMNAPEQGELIGTFMEPLLCVYACEAVSERACNFCKACEVFSPQKLANHKT